MDAKKYDRYMLTSRRVIAIVNGVLSFSFFSRSFYQILAMIGFYRLPNIPIQVHAFIALHTSHCNGILFSLQGDDDVHFTILLCFTLWDYVPTVLLITTVTSRVLGDNSYYTNSILQSYSSMLNRDNSRSNVNMLYTSRSRSGDKGKRNRSK